jgi:surface polysaccharide O-acyltransferase-like enzyme
VYAIDFAFYITVAYLLYSLIKKVDEKYPQTKEFYMIIFVVPLSLSLGRLLFLSFMHYLEKRGFTVPPPPRY